MIPFDGEVVGNRPSIVAPGPRLAARNASVVTVEASEGHPAVGAVHQEPRLEQPDSLELQTAGGQIERRLRHLGDPAGEQLAGGSGSRQGAFAEPVKKRTQLYREIPNRNFTYYSRKKMLQVIK